MSSDSSYSIGSAGYMPLGDNGNRYSVGNTSFLNPKEANEIIEGAILAGKEIVWCLPNSNITTENSTIGIAHEYGEYVVLFGRWQKTIFRKNGGETLYIENIGI
jgi:hypothetical protein